MLQCGHWRKPLDCGSRDELVEVSGRKSLRVLGEDLRWSYSSAETVPCAGQSGVNAATAAGAGVPVVSHSQTIMPPTVWRWPKWM